MACSDTTVVVIRVFGRHRRRRQQRLRPVVTIARTVSFTPVGTAMYATSAKRVTDAGLAVHVRLAAVSIRDPVDTRSRAPGRSRTTSARPVTITIARTVWVVQILAWHATTVTVKTQENVRLAAVSGTFMLAAQIAHGSTSVGRRRTTSARLAAVSVLVIAAITATGTRARLTNALLTGAG